jgi:uncharacterized protein YjbI with pentapeptide repeats
VTGTVLVIAVAFVTPVLVTSAPAGADTVINGCTIVSNPTPTNFTNCPGVDLSLESLSGMDLSYANLSSTGLVDTELFNTNLTSANLTGATMATCFVFGIRGLVCLGADLTDANLTGANLTNAGLAACGTSAFGFTECGSANLTGTLLVPSDQTVTATSSAGAVVTWPTPQSLPGATPGSCTPPSGSTFGVGTNFVNCQVSDDFGNVAGGSFTVTVLRPISLVSIPCKKLAGCNLSGFDLSYTILSGADLEGANLMNANLSGDVLSGADLQGANLMGANLSGADLSGANLKGANLNEVAWSNTTCPDGTNSNNDGGTCVGHL